MIKRIVGYAAAILLILMICTVAAGQVKEMLTVTKNSSTEERAFPEKLNTQNYD
jgi:hypothetical protein